MTDELSMIGTSPDMMSGTPVFARTRVPVQTLLDYLTCNAPGAFGSPLQANC